VSNLRLACGPCNQRKGNRTAAEFGFGQLMDRAKAPLKDAAAVNTTRWALWRSLSTLGLFLETGSGGRTKWNRTRLGFSKSHWADAACVGTSTPNNLSSSVEYVLLIAAKGHGSRQMCGTDKYGFPIQHKRRQKRYFEYQTGDLVKARVPVGKRQGTHVGRVLVRASGTFDITTRQRRQAGISHRHLRMIRAADGYAYTTRKEARGSPQALAEGGSVRFL
jgi:hypothetical protein